MTNTRNTQVSEDQQNGSKQKSLSFLVNDLGIRNLKNAATLKVVTI